jgi:hypothetical protein
MKHWVRFIFVNVTKHLDGTRNLHISSGWMKKKKVQSHVIYYGIFMAIKALGYANVILYRHRSRT